MKQNMMAEERRRAISRQLNRRMSLTVEEAAELYNVSMDTVRRDFRYLASLGHAVRTYGGIVHSDIYAREHTIRERTNLQHEAKARIGRYAATLIDASETVAIDAGTTAIEVVPNLIGVPGLTLLTYSLDVARAVTDADLGDCFLLGGMVRRNTYTCVGPETRSTLKNFHATTLLLATNAISLKEQLMTPNHMEAEIKRGLIEISRRVILLADSSKLGRLALVRFGTLDDVDMLITDSGADAGLLEKLGNSGVEIVCV